MRSRSGCLLFAVGSLLLCGSPARAQQTAVFDSLTGLDPSILGNIRFPGGTAPRSYLGQAVEIDLIPGGGVPQITAIEFYVGYTGADAIDFTSVEARIQFWDGYSDPPSNADTNLVFSDPIGGPINVALGPISFPALGSEARPARNFRFDLPTPITLTDTFFGVAFNIQGVTASGPLADPNSLLVAIRGGSDIAPLIPGDQPAPPFAAGRVPRTAPNFGYFRNVSGRTDFNFQSNDARQIGPNSAIAMRLFTGTAVAVPESSTLTLAGFSLFVAVGAVLRRRRSSRAI